MRSLFFIVFICSFHSLTAQDIPAKASKYVRHEFPKSNTLSWITLPAGYECRFKYGQSFVSVKFDPYGSWIESRKLFGKDETPSVANGLLDNFQGGEVTSVEQVDRKTSTRYEVMVSHEERMLKVTCDTTGKVLSKTVVANSKRYTEE